MTHTKSAGLVGKSCPYCQTPIKPNTTVRVCEACGIPHHSECWQDNGGCTTFGCPSRAGTAASSSVANPLIEASKNGDLQSVKRLAKENPSWVNARDASGLTALHWALETRHSDVARALVVAGAEPICGDAPTFRVAGWGRRLTAFVVDAIISRIGAALVASWLSTSDNAGGVMLLLLPLYYVLFEAAFQKTPGKLLAGTRVVSLSGAKPKMTQFIGRSLSRFVPFEAIAGSVEDGWWHDRWSGTVVVRG